MEFFCTIDMSIRKKYSLKNYTHVCFCWHLPFSPSIICTIVCKLEIASDETKWVPEKEWKLFFFVCNMIVSFFLFRSSLWQIFFSCDDEFLSSFSLGSIKGVGYLSCYGKIDKLSVYIITANLSHDIRNRHNYRDIPQKPNVIIQARKRKTGGKTIENWIICPHHQERWSNINEYHFKPQNVWAIRICY